VGHLRPSLHLQTLCREVARKGRGAGVDHAHVQALLPPGCHRASVVGTVPGPLRFLLSALLMHMKKKATDRFMRDSIGGCYGAQRFLLLQHTLHHHRPVLSGNSGLRVFRPRSSVLEKRRIASLTYIIFCQKGLDLEIQFA
jgi:hypothetical protein